MCLFNLFFNLFQVVVFRLNKETSILLEFKGLFVRKIILQNYVYSIKKG